MKKNKLILAIVTVILVNYSRIGAADLNKQIRINAVIPTVVVNTVGMKADFHYFSGQSVEFNIVVNGETAEPVDVRAKLYQVGFSLGAPLDQEITVYENVKFSNQSIGEAKFDLKLPVVQRETLLELAYDAKLHAGDEWSAVGRTLIRVYPENLVESLEGWSKRIQLKVRDDEGQLTKFLDKNRIKYVDAKASSIDAKIPVFNMIVSAGSSVQDFEPDLNAGEAYIFFNKSSEGLPKIEITGRKVYVDMDLLSELAVNPLHQKAFLEIIEMVQ